MFSPQTQTSVTLERFAFLEPDPQSTSCSGVHAPSCDVAIDACSELIPKKVSPIERFVFLKPDLNLPLVLESVLHLVMSPQMHVLASNPGKCHPSSDQLFLEPDPNLFSCFGVHAPSSDVVIDARSCLGPKQVSPSSALLFSTSTSIYSCFGVHAPSSDVAINACSCLGPKQVSPLK